MSADHNHARHAPESYASQFETVSGLRQWTAWLAVLLAITLVLVVAYFTNLIEAGMYVVIFALAVGTIVKSYYDARFLDRETKLASAQVQELAELNDVSAFLARAKKSIFRAHIESLYAIFLAHPDISQDNLIEVLHSRLMARNRVAELFASILITLGLLGTIVGLIMMMEGLQRTVASMGDQEANVMARLMGADGPMKGLGAAFYTTLLGALFGGVILRILTSVVDANIMRYTAHLAELTEVNVLPFMRRSAQRLSAAGYYERIDEPADEEPAAEHAAEALST